MSCQDINSMSLRNCIGFFLHFKAQNYASRTLANFVYNKKQFVLSCDQPYVDEDSYKRNSFLT